MRRMKVLEGSLSFTPAGVSLILLKNVMCQEASRRLQLHLELVCIVALQAWLGGHAPLQLELYQLRKVSWTPGRLSARLIFAKALQLRAAHMCAFLRIPCDVLPPDGRLAFWQTLLPCLRNGAGVRLTGPVWTLLLVSGPLFGRVLS